MRLFTIGYAGYAAPVELAAVLAGAGVARLIDVRERPYSRRRGFSKTALAAALAEAGIAYEHWRELGNPFRDAYRAGDVEGGRQLYAGLLRERAAVLDALLESLASYSTCLLCLETDRRECHRDVIVEELLRRDPLIAVEHL